MLSDEKSFDIVLFDRNSEYFKVKQCLKILGKKFIDIANLGVWEEIQLEEGDYSFVD